MKNFRTEGIIIKRRNSGEADRVVTILTSSRGKIQAKAVGVRRISSRRSPHIEQLNLSTLSFYQGRAFPLLLEAQTIEPFSSIKNDLEKVGIAYYICELIDKLCPENQENPYIFSILLRTLRNLSSQMDKKKVMRVFEQSMLMQMGYLPKQAYREIFDSTAFIEQIMERKLKSRQLLSRFI